MIKYLPWVIAIVLAGWAFTTIIVVWYKTTEDKTQGVARLLAQDIGKHVDLIDIQWGTTSGHPEVKIYGFHLMINRP